MVTSTMRVRSEKRRRVEEKRSLAPKTRQNDLRCFDMMTRDTRLDHPKSKQHDEMLMLVLVASSMLRSDTVDPPFKLTCVQLR